MTWTCTRSGCNALRAGLTEAIVPVRRIALLETALAHAKEKLELYRQAHSRMYIGGVEYTALIREIDEAASFHADGGGKHGDI